MPYPDLLKEKGGTGFPSLFWMDADGNVLARQGERSVEGFTKTLKNLKAHADLKAKAAKGDRAATVDLLVSEIELGKLDFDAASKQAKGLGELTNEQKARIDGLLLGLEVSKLASARTPDARAAASKQMLGMMKEGRIPTGNAARLFYSMVLTAAEAEKDAKAFEQAMEGIKQLVGDDARAKPMLDSMQKRLDKLKGDGDK